MFYLFILLIYFFMRSQQICRKDVAVTFTPHLSITIKHLTRYKQEIVLATMLEGKSIPPPNMASSTNHTTLLKNQSAIKYLP